MGFDAGDVEALSYDFRDYGPKGVTPEPTTDQIRHFRKRVLATFNSLKTDGDDTELGGDNLAVRFLSLPPEQRDEVNDDLVDAVAELCAGHPTLEEIRALPARIRSGFVGSIFEAFADPLL